MIDALLYHVRVHALSRKRVEITLMPTWLGNLLKRRTRKGVAFQSHDEDDILSWWWLATHRYVGEYIERYIEAAPILTIDDMTVEQLLLDEPPTPSRK